MATRTSVGSGDWSAVGTWDTGVPADGDTVIIAAGTTVDFDVDQSAFATGITLRIDGVLTVKAGADRYMKLDASVTFGASGTREWRIGSAETPFPIAHKFTLDLNGAREVTLTDGTLLWYCAEPTTKYVRLSAVEAAGQTELSVDTDVTGEGDYWRAGAEVRIDNVNRTNDSEARTIDSVAAGAITVTAGLTAEKIAGTLILLITRNIRVIGQTGTGRCVYGGTGSYIGAEIRPASGGSGVNGHVSGTIAGTISASSYGAYSCAYCTVSGVVSGCTTGLYNCHSTTLSGVASGSSTAMGGGPYQPIVSGLVSGCGSGFYNSYGGILLAAGVISGCRYGYQSCWGGMAAGAISNCSNAINASTGVVASCAFSDCAYAVSNSGALLVGATFVNTTFANRADYVVADARLIRSYDHNGTPGDTRSYSGGGYGASDATTPAPGFADSFKLTMTSASHWNRMEEEIVAKKDVPLIISIAAKNGATGLTQRARVELIEGPSEDPIVGGTPTKQYIAPDDTDWHIDRWFLMPTADTIYTIRGSAKHGSQNAWVAWRVEPAPQESA